MSMNLELMKKIDSIPFVEGFSDAFFTCGMMVSPCIYISGNPVYSGIDFLNIKPGDKIAQVGEKVSGSAAINRIDYFKTFVIYKGILKTKLMSKESQELQLLLFQLNPEEETTANVSDKYIAYIILRNVDKFELKVPAPNFNVNFIFQPIFKKTS